MAIKPDYFGGYKEHMNSFIKWVGGKRLLRGQILAEFPADFTSYVEVFGGAAWLLFAKEKHAETEVYNDVNHDLVNLFRCMKYHGNALQEELKWSMVSREMFQESVADYRNPNLTDIQRAARFFILVKCSFGAKMENFSGSRVSLANTVIHMEKFQKRLRNTIIEQMDFERLIRQYDRAGTLFYTDPPYYQAEGYYDSGFGEPDHVRLRETLEKIKGKFVLTYNDCPFIRELYRDYPKLAIERQSNIASFSTESKYKELVIKNF